MRLRRGGSSRRTTGSHLHVVRLPRPTDIPTVPAGVCWRCGVAYDETTPADLAFGAALARAACVAADPLHYTEAEVIDGWAGPRGGAREWLHRRAARRDDG